MARLAGLVDFTAREHEYGGRIGNFARERINIERIRTLPAKKNCFAYLRRSLLSRSFHMVHCTICGTQPLIGRRSSFLTRFAEVFPYLSHLVSRNSHGETI